MKYCFKCKVFYSDIARYEPYSSPQDRNAFGGDSSQYYCPNISCNGLMIDLDEQMIGMIEYLYDTFGIQSIFSCSGHSHNGFPYLMMLGNPFKGKKFPRGIHYEVDYDYIMPVLTHTGETYSKALDMYDIKDEYEYDCVSTIRWYPNEYDHKSSSSKLERQMSVNTFYNVLGKWFMKQAKEKESE